MAAGFRRPSRNDYRRYCDDSHSNRHTCREAGIQCQDWQRSRYQQTFSPASGITKNLRNTCDVLIYRYEVRSSEPRLDKLQITSIESETLGLNTAMILS